MSVSICPVCNIIPSPLTRFYQWGLLTAQDNQSRWANFSKWYQGLQPYYVRLFAYGPLLWHDFIMTYVTFFPKWAWWHQNTTNSYFEVRKGERTEQAVAKFGNHQWRIQLHSPEHCRNGKIFTKGTVFIHLTCGLVKLSDSNIVLAFTLMSQKCRVQSSPHLCVSIFIVLVWNKINCINSGQFQ